MRSSRARAFARCRLRRRYSNRDLGGDAMMDGMSMFHRVCRTPAPTEAIHERRSYRLDFPRWPIAGDAAADRRRCVELELGPHVGLATNVPCLRLLRCPMR